KDEPDSCSSHEDCRTKLVNECDGRICKTYTKSANYTPEFPCESPGFEQGCVHQVGRCDYSNGAPQCIVSKEPISVPSNCSRDEHCEWKPRCDFQELGDDNWSATCEARYGEGFDCESPEDCLESIRFCKNERCEPRMVPIESQPFGDYCSEDTECQKVLVCFLGTCSLTEHRQGGSASLCPPSAVVGDPCEEQPDVEDPPRPSEPPLPPKKDTYYHCVGRACIATTSQPWVPCDPSIATSCRYDGRRVCRYGICLPPDQRDTSGIPDECSNDLECEPEFKACTSDGMCKPVRGVTRDECEADDQCGFNQCINQMCVRQFGAGSDDPACAGAESAGNRCNTGVAINRSQDSALASMRWPVQSEAEVQRKRESAELLSRTSVKAILGQSFAFTGNADAALEVQVFHDAGCGMCKYAMKEIVPGVVKDFVETGHAKLVFREMPLIPRAFDMERATAFQCAAEQGRHYEFIRHTYDKGKDINTGEFAALAKEVGLDQSAFRECLVANGSALERVKKDMAIAKKLKIEGTPTFVINGKIVKGAMPYHNFKELLYKELQK
ncbi:MAG: thioredoxin domain-containing protein, partial [Bdellovibrionales bacterium]|nr:thioredoxin domain-containing protein [Bdellovibrionales bacterium]